MKLIMVSAGFENAGNCLHRHLDSHPNLLVYPFESMLGTPLSSNLLTPAIPFRYAWPVFDSETAPLQAYHSFYDEEMKTYLRTRDRSKFKDCGMDIDEKDRIKIFEDFCKIKNNDVGKRQLFIEAYFASAFGAWRNMNKTDQETHFVGYIPGVLMDTDKIIQDFPDAKIIHIIRNPWSGYADTIKRPFPQSCERYCQIWNTLQLNALNYCHKYPDNFHTVFFEDLCRIPDQTMKYVLDSLGLPWSENVTYPSFNGKKLESIYPWGTIKKATVEENFKTANLLSGEQKKKIYDECSVILNRLSYFDLFMI